MSEPTTMQEMVDGQLAELQITTAEVTGETYKERHAAKIAALAEEEAALPTPTDKASLQVVQDFITKSEKARTGIDKFRKAFKDRWKPMLDAVDAYLGTTKENGRQAEIYAIQQRAEAKKKAYLDEQAKAQREAERLLEERYQGRLKKLMDAGMSFDGTALLITEGENSLSALATQVRFATDEQMAAVLGKVEAIAERKREAEAAAQQAKEALEREEAEERERLRVQKEEQDAAAAKLKAEREQLDREREEMADSRAETRGADLVVLGATAHGYGPAAMRYEIGDVIVGHGELRHMDADTWASTRERVRLAKVKAIEADKEHERQMNLRADRIAEVVALGATHEYGILTIGEVGECESNYGKLTSDEWAPVLARFKEAAEARDNMGDKVLPIAGPGQHIKDGKVYFDAVCDESNQLQEGSAVVGAQPVDNGVPVGMAFKVRVVVELDVFVASADDEDHARQQAMQWRTDNNDWEVAHERISWVSLNNAAPVNGK